LFLFVHVSQIKSYYFITRRKKSSKAPAKKSTPAKGGRRGKKDQSEEEGEIASDDKEFDDGLDEDLIGNIVVLNPT
jgi:hypothetical protein